jgi:Zn-dependent protease with chaperone function
MGQKVILSEDFKNSTYKSIFSIFVFIFVYFILLISTIGITIYASYFGIFLIFLIPNFLTFFVGAGLISFGILIFIFLIKFIFKKHKTDRSNIIEIFEKDEKDFFNFIKEIVLEVNTNFPKKIYLSNEVNASVFYDSSFWSMFLPIPKNLVIGMGLINSCTKQELKAILAHEFGHFSQRSMKVGSYVYNVNQIIYNLLNDNDNFENIIQKFGNINAVVSLFVTLAVKIIISIQWVLKKMYKFVNLNYMALSRAMEFHADEIAANVVGINPLKDILLRLNFTSHAFNVILNFYESKIESNQKSKNIYLEHQFVYQFLAKKNDIILNNNLPQLTLTEINKYNKSKLEIKDQWSSHPTILERIKSLDKLKIEKKENNTDKAFDLFRNPTQTQEKLTSILFSNIDYKTETTFFEFDEFSNEFEKKYMEDSFPDVYNGYYDEKNPSIFNINTIENNEIAQNLKNLFSNEKVNLVNELIVLENDKSIVSSISKKEIDVESFHYDGNIFTPKTTKFLLQKIDDKIHETKEIIYKNDIEIYKYFLQLAVLKNKEKEINEYYNTFFTEDLNYNIKIEIFNKFVDASQFIQQRTENNTIEMNFISLATIEYDLKTEIKKILEDKNYESILTVEIKDCFNKYLLKEYNYLRNGKYNDRNLEMLFSVFNYFYFIINKHYFNVKKALLNFKSELL